MIQDLKADFTSTYKGFKLNRILEPQYRHLLLMLFWPFFLASFFISEQMAVDRGFTIVHCALDDQIPFCEYFVIPYVIWYPFWILMVLYTVAFDVPAFIKFMKYMMMTLSLALFIYLFWPSGHDMWPEKFPRENFFTWIVGLIYKADHPTNICPSEHVSTAFGVVMAAYSTKRLSTKKWMIYFWTEAILVAFSVVFIKQHSIIDVAAAVPLIFVGYLWAYFPDHQKKWKEKRSAKRKAAEATPRE